MQDPEEDQDGSELPEDFEDALREISPEDLKRTLQETFLEMHATAVLGQGTPLRFPDEVHERVEAYREEHAIVLDELIPRAVAAQVERVDEIVKAAHRLRKDPSSFEWPIEDPFLCVAIAFVRESMNCWINKVNEEYSDQDQAGWWKADESE